MLYAPSSELRDDWVRDLHRAIEGDFPQEQKDKELQKQGNELTKKRDDGDTVKKISKKKAAEQQSEDSD